MINLVFWDIGEYIIDFFFGYIFDFDIDEEEEVENCRRFKKRWKDFER